MTNENMKNNLELEKWEREVEMAIKKVAEAKSRLSSALCNRDKMQLRCEALKCNLEKTQNELKAAESEYQEFAKFVEELNLRVGALENRLAEFKARTENVGG